MTRGNKEGRVGKHEDSWFVHMKEFLMIIGVIKLFKIVIIISIIINQHYLKSLYANSDYCM